MAELKPVPMSLKPVVSAGFEMKLVCVSVGGENAPVRVFEGDLLHDCMREVNTAIFNATARQESHPRMDLVLELVGEVPIFSIGKIYKLRIEPDE